MEFGSEKYIHPSSDVLDEQVHGLKHDVDRVPILDLQATLNVLFSEWEDSNRPMLGDVSTTPSMRCCQDDRHQHTSVSSLVSAGIESPLITLSQSYQATG